MPRPDDLPAIRHVLTESLEALACLMLGDPVVRRGRVWRWGKKGSLAVVMQGAKRGSWHDHEAGQGGGPLDLIMLGKRLNIADAIAWARQWTGATADDAAPAAPSAWRVEAEAREREEQLAAIGNARWLAHRSVAVAGSIADSYLTATRGISPPGGGWPDAVRWFPGASARDSWPDAVRWHAGAAGLLLIATSAAGDTQAVQHVRLMADPVTGAGRKPDDGRLVKITAGVGAGAAVRLPGPAAGPLLLAEGPETGLSVWAAGGHETWITLGSVTRAVPPAGRALIVCRDDDALPGIIARDARRLREAGRGAEAVRLETKLAGRAGADHRLAEAVAAWRAAGCRVAIVTPWRTRRGDGSDMNDAMQERGADFVLSRLDRALASLERTNESDVPPADPTW